MNALGALQFVAELERLRGLEASLEGPTLVDWEEELSREGSLKLAEEVRALLYNCPVFRWKLRHLFHHHHHYYLF